ncbi:MAG: S-layer homology domain-containing protein [Oscillospiraceae bacterium]|nr:S-layer homology domain-containing protein [Oscillospiraceae bacterium]
MRTLKKSLALVLAIVLVVGVCVFNAAAFTDDEAITCDEAVAVLTGIGVIKGRDTGAFDPTATLTRAEAATIITRLKGQEDLQAKSKFDDMQGHWAESYVAYCAAEGIVNGVGDNKFDPDAKLTGNQWGKMLLVAMGFDPAETGLDKGDTWEVAVAKLVKDKKLKVGVETLDMNAPISREQTCVLAFNALPQSVSGERAYVVEGVVFDNATDAMLYSLMSHKEITVTTPSDALQANFPSLEETAAEDDFGRPAHEWTYGEGVDKESIYLEVEAPAYSYVATKAETVSVDVLNSNLKLKTAKTMLTGSPVVLKNGDAATAYVAGDLVEVYTDKLEAQKVVISHYDLATVTKVAELKKSEIVEDDPSTVKINIKLAGGTEIKDIRDAQFADFAYAEDDYALVAVNSAKEILASQAAETVSGKIDATRGAEVRINGNFYGIASKTIGTLTATRGTEATWALDAAGDLAANVEVKEAATKSTDYAMIYNVVATESETGGLNPDGYDDSTTSKNYTVYAVLTDGSKISAPAWTDKDGKVQADVSGFTAPKVVAYEMKDGKLKIVEGEYTMKTLNDISLNKASKVDDGAYADGSTVYISGAKDTEKNVFVVSTVTGYKNAKLTDADITYVANEKKVLYVFTADGISAVEAEPEYAVAVLANAEPIVTTDEDDNDVYTYTVIIDGAETDLVVDAPITGVVEGQVFEYELADTTFTLKKAYDFATDGVTVEFVSGNQVMAGGKEYSQASAKVYAFNEDGEIEAGTLKEDQKVILIANDKGVISYAFIEYVAET